MKRLLKVSLIGIGMMLLCSGFVSAKELSFTVDGNKVSLEAEAKACYLIFDETDDGLKINGKNAPHPDFLHQYIELSGNKEITIDGAKPIEMHFFDSTDVPSWVQIWEEPCDRADLLLISSHADDEQLFFAGVLPYYSQVKGLKVQVAYATDHVDNLTRHHERLNGLWAVGIRNYPVSSGYPDLYSENAEWAFDSLKYYGITEEDLIAWEKDLLTRFTPKVVVTHDLNGEYGHGMHMAVSGSLLKALEGNYPFLRRVYLHLYDQNPLSLDVIDQSFPELGGRTPFEVTRDDGFACHESQHWTWFKSWIYGAHTTYSPLSYGCYYSSDGTYAKNDFFEGITSYEEDRIEAERLAEEQRQKEEAEKLEAERLAAEAKKKQTIQSIAAICAGLLIIAVVLILALKKKKKKEEKKDKYIPKH